MRSRRRPIRAVPAGLDPTAARLQDLELRVRVLETRVRELLGKLKLQPTTARERTAATRPTRRTRTLPRCPGCTLELPRGRRGLNCIWCGFRLDVVAGRTL